MASAAIAEPDHLVSGDQWGALLARLDHGDLRTSADAYVYLAESIQAWPAQDELARIVGSCGWTDVRFRNLTGGVVALHLAERG